MIELKKYGAIDIGSNAIRLLVSNVIIQEGKEPQFKKSALIRLPVRLGADAFVSGIISEENISRMIDAMEAFKLLMKVHKVERFKACATSAMREAFNGEEVVKKVFEKTGIKISIIGGKEEAVIISSNNLKELIKGTDSYLYVDVGGGSTEFTIFSEEKIIISKSFNMGTVRLLNNTKSENKEIFENVERWIRKNTQDLKRISLIGSGGNINKIFKMSGLMEGKPISFVYLHAQYQFLKQMSYEDRIS